MRRLNTAPLPVLGSPASPQYSIISGQKIDVDDGVPVTRPDDGLITLAGADLCAANPLACATADLTQEIVPSSAAAPMGLCHSGALGLMCGGQAPNIPMAEVTGKDHVLWDRICSFLESDAEKCKRQLRLTITPADPRIGGTVAADGSVIDCGSRCAVGFVPGALVHLTATAAAGFAFSGWSGDCDGHAACDVIMDDDRQVTANFTCVDPTICGPPHTLTVNVSPSNGGRVTSDAAHPGIDCGTACTATYPASTIVTLTASAASGYRFIGWSGACTGTQHSVDVILSDDRSCVAAFSQTELDLTISNATCDIVPYPLDPMRKNLSVKVSGLATAPTVGGTFGNSVATLFICSNSPDCLGFPQVLERAECGGWSPSGIDFLSGCQGHVGETPSIAWQFDYFYGLFFTVPESAKNHVVTARLAEHTHQQRVLERAVQVRCQ